jgi:hypothetical protein
MRRLQFIVLKLTSTSRRSIFKDINGNVTPDLRTVVLKRTNNFAGPSYIVNYST